jgi:UDP-glucose 4-epimerase
MLNHIKDDETILVTGGAGYIGSHAIHHLIDAGITPVVIDNLATGIRGAIPKDIPFYEGSVGDNDLLEEIFTAHKIKAILHFAGSVVVPESVEDPGKYFTNNAYNTLVLIKAMIAANICHLVFSSTAAVYGMPGGDLIPIKEDAPTTPINPYGTSKLMSEMMIADMASAHDLKAVILRYFNVAGADAQGRAGQSTPEATHLIKVVAEVVTGKRDKMKIFGNDYDTPDGTCVRDYIHVDDLITAHLLALDYLEGISSKDGDNTVTLNCGYGRGYSVAEVIEAAGRISGKNINCTMAPRRAGDPPLLTANSTACQQVLGWRPQSGDLDLIISSALAWEEKQS